MEISQICLDLIKKWEGFRANAYLDPVGIPTIGYGTIRYPNGQPVELGDI
ncbi:MAG: lysozyme, partial [Microcystis sp.]